jgi:hypothetical protein
LPEKGKKTPGIFTKLFLILRNIIGWNIGTMVFAVLLLYMLLSACIYLTSSHIESYQVTAGPLSRNDTYTGLAVREEIVSHAQSNGYVTYFAREGSKINANGVVYGLSSTQIPETAAVLSSEDLAKIRNEMLSFSKRFNPSRFNTTYSFKYQLEGNILQYAGVMADVITLSDQIHADSVADSRANVVLLGNQTLCKSEYDGIVLYSKDDYAGKKIEDLTPADFNQANYHETDLKTTDSVKAGDDIYTLITDERWSLLIPLSDRQTSRLRDRQTIRVKFLKDDMTQSGDFSIIQLHGENYGKIDFTKGLIRYAADRFLDIELVTNTATGLKIPLTSITTKEFYTIPGDYLSSDGTSFYVEERVKGETARRQVSPTIYASIPNENTTYVMTEETRAANTRLYVDKSVFKKGEVLVKPDSGERYVIRDTDVLEGVYCINPGYAVFRRIVVLDQNDEFAIVEKDTNYGLVRYDHIVRNARQIKEQDILY